MQGIAFDIVVLSTLPRVVRFADVELSVKELGSLGVCGKFLFVILGDCEPPLLVRRGAS